MNRPETTVCGCCRAQVDVVRYFTNRTNEAMRTAAGRAEVEANGQRHCLYPDGRVQWCYATDAGAVLVCGRTPEQQQAFDDWARDLQRQFTITEINRLTRSLVR